MLTLAVEKRERTGKVSKQLLSEGKIPAIVYGKKQEAIAVKCDLKEFEKVWNEAGESSVFELSGLGENLEVLIHEVDIDPIHGNPRHVDFYAIEKGKKVEVSVPLSFVGVAPAEKELSGILTKVLHELDVEAFPKDLPHEIEVDISVLVDFDSQIHAKDIALPSGVELITGADEVVALVSEAKEEPEEEPAEALDLDSIEVEKKGKDEESAEESGGGDEKKDE